MTVLVFPHQLFEAHPLLRQKRSVLIIEDSLFFGDKHHPASFHKQKLAYYRATMQAYRFKLEKKGHSVSYIDYAKASSLEQVLKAHKITKAATLDPTDFLLEKRLKRACKALGINLSVQPSSLHLNTRADNEAYFSDHKWLMANFYKHQRKRLGVLVKNGKPFGGQWSFDDENRKKLPKRLIPALPALPSIKEDDILKEARAYVEAKFPDNYGQLNGFYYPYTHKKARAWLKTFLEERFTHFGPYEDAIVEGQNWLYHGVLTPMVNTGLLTPQLVLEESLKYADNHDISLSSLEGFVRQLIGWREYMRAAYDHHGVTMRTSNHWEHTNNMPEAFYTAQTGILPIDDALSRLLKTGYCHHIERLMVLSGFMFLCEIHPQAIYRWFMEMFIDSYDWVMVPNVYAMSQNSAGGLITTKPYFSSSNYIRNMSHYGKGDWCDVWDGLYWRFIIKNEAKLANNARWSMMLRQASRLDKDRKKRIMSAAEGFLEEHVLA